MGATKERLQTSAALLRAAELGREIETILGDTSLQRLSKDAWLRMAGELAGGDLDELRERVAALPYLQILVASMARRWIDHGQDRPVADPIFRNATGDLGPSYAERLTAGLSVEACSAVVALFVAELAPSSRWGRLESFDEVPGLVDPLRAELEVLDDQLAAELRVRDIVWEGHRATLRAGSVSAVLDSESAARPGTAIAAAARDAARGVALAA